MIRVMRQGGFTLIEVLVTLAVGGVILIGIVSSMQMVTVGSSRSNSEVVALDEVNRAFLYIKKDLSTYNNIDLNVTLPDLITISWSDETAQEGGLPWQYEVTYSLSGTELLRIYTINDSPASEQIIGRHITYLSFTSRTGINGRFIDVVITATKGDMTPRSETLSFSVYQLREVEE
ncbi:type II secretion system protein J [Chloroflexota bacterium]